MPYTKQIWTDEAPSSTPVKYKISQSADGDIAASAEIELITSVTPGSPLNSTRLNYMEEGIETAQETAEAKTTLADALAAVYPVGCIYTTTISTNPATVFGFGTWSSFGSGRVLVGLDVGQTEFNTIEKTGGAKTHALTSTEMPSHTHVQNAHTHTQNAHSHSYNQNPDYGSNVGSGSNLIAVNSQSVQTGSTTATNQNATATNQNTGGDGAHNNLQPYITVYFFKRTA